MNIVDAITRITARQDAQRTCERAFCETLARYTGHDLADVANLFGMLSPNLQDLVHSPQGWAALGRLMVSEPSAVPVLASIH